MATGPKPVPAPTIVTVPAPESQPRTTGIVELPSRGLLYGDRCPDGVVELFPMTGREETLVAGMTAANVSEIFDIILKRCIKPPTDPNKALPVDEMLATDKFYLMLVLRANSYGSRYEFATKCPECGARVDASCNVPDDFELKMAPKEFREPFTVELPRAKVPVEFRLLRGKDETDIIRYARREASKGQELGDPSFVYRLAKHILSVDGKPYDIAASLRFVEELIGEDISVLREAIDDATPGVLTVVNLECTAMRCGNFFRADMPFTAGFFRTNRGGKRKPV